MKHEENYSKLILAHAPRLNVALYLNLLERYQFATTILAQPHNKLLAMGLHGNTVDFLKQPPSFTQDIEWSSHPNHQMIFVDDPEYPQLLKNIPDPPKILYIKGDAAWLWYPQIAVVGPRKPSASGVANTRSLTEKLIQAGFLITSGMAEGIDAVAHKTSLALKHPTIAVAACGLDMVYPRNHKQLASNIANNGIIVSEYSIGSQPKKYCFPRRNRIISGLTMGTLVVEATLKSGSLITARHAMEQNREVFAVPSSISNPLAKGCHQLIKEGAKLVEEINDITIELQSMTQYAKWQTRQIKGKIKHSNKNEIINFTELNEIEQLLLKVMEFDPVTIDELAQRSDLPIHSITNNLINLELMGIVLKHRNGTYIRVK